MSIVSRLHPVNSLKPQIWCPRTTDLQIRYSLDAARPIHVKVIQSTLIGSPMSPWWTSYVAPEPQGRLKNAKQPCLCKIALHLKKVCYKASLCECHQQQGVRQSLAYLSVQKMVRAAGEGHLRQNMADFQSILARSASASEKKFN